MNSGRILAASVVVTCVAVCSLVASPGAYAADEAYQRELSQLLDVGWGASSRALGPAEQHFEAAQLASPGDQRAIYAFALVNLKHRRYARAAELLDEALASHPEDLFARQAKTWLLVLTKKYDAALVEVEAIGEVLQSDDSRKARPEAATETAHFLGRSIGYLAGPAEKAVDQALLERAVKKLEAGFSTAEARAFDQGRDDVLKQYDELSLRNDQARTDALEEETEHKERLAQQLADERAAVAGQKSEVDELASKARSAVDAKLAELEQQIAPLNLAFNRLEASSRPIGARIADLDRDIGGLLHDADDSPDPQERAYLRREADRLSRLRNQHEVQYAALDAEARQINAQRSVLANQRQQAIVQYEEAMQRLGREAVNLRKREKRVAVEERAVARPASGNNAGVRSQAARVAAFTTYHQFPLEQERQRLLKTLR